ncbi:MAG: glycosyltransferase, partial [Deltaproteobacteria bacterium]|nr:glycosyltransferase [Deltaproteobacteria bacterium]
MCIRDRYYANLGDNKFVLPGRLRVEVMGLKNNSKYAQSIEYLLSLPNVVYLGPKKYSEIPSLLKACDIGLIPFKKGRLTEFVEKPLKYYEYLAAGLPVVATGLAHSDDKSPYLKNLRDPKLFIEAIRKTDIMNSAERIKISLSVKDSCWKNVFLRLENFIGKETN